MELIVETSKLKQLLKEVLYAKTSPLLETAIASAKPDGIAFLDLSLQVIGYYALYKRNYFLDYKCENPEVIPISKSVYEKLSDCFKDSKQIKLSTTNEKIYIRSEKETYEENLIAMQKPEYPFKFVKRPYGVLPEQFQPTVCVQLKSSELDFPPAEDYTLKVENKTLILEITDVGRYEKKLEIMGSPAFETVLTENARIVLDADYFKRITANLIDDVTLSWDKSGWFAIFMQTPEHHVTYYLAEKSVKT